jgi:hypothetical protein
MTEGSRVTIVPFAPVADRWISRSSADGNRPPARLFDLKDLSERARLNDNQDHADRLLLAAWLAPNDDQSEATHP